MFFSQLVQNNFVDDSDASISACIRITGQLMKACKAERRDGTRAEERNTYKASLRSSKIIDKDEVKNKRQVNEYRCFESGELLVYVIILIMNINNIIKGVWYKINA